jgi:hypothetical protein
LLLFFPKETASVPTFAAEILGFLQRGKEK